MDMKKYLLSEYNRLYSEKLCRLDELSDIEKVFDDGKLVGIKFAVNGYHGFYDMVDYVFYL